MRLTQSAPIFTTYTICFHARKAFAELVPCIKSFTLLDDDDDDSDGGGGGNKVKPSDY